MEFSAGGSLSTPDEQELERYKKVGGEQDVVFSVQPARDKYDYPKMMLTKQLDLGRGKPPAGWSRPLTAGEFMEFIMKCSGTMRV